MHLFRFLHCDFSVRIESAINHWTNARKWKHWTPHLKCFILRSECERTICCGMIGFPLLIFSLSFDGAPPPPPPPPHQCTRRSVIAIAWFNYLITRTYSTVWRIIIFSEQRKCTWYWWYIETEARCARCTVEDKFSINNDENGHAACQPHFLRSL